MMADLGVHLESGYNLGGLATETRLIIGDAARRAYKDLNKLPPRHSEPLDIPPGSDRSAGGRILRGRRIVRVAELPEDMPGPLERSGSVTETVTETYERRLYRHGHRVLSLPASDRLVTVKYMAPDQDDIAFRHSTMSISTRGYAKADSRTDHTFPWDVDGTDYDDPDRLADDFARGFGGALKVTRCVLGSLYDVHGLENPAAPAVAELADAWEQVSPGATGRIVQAFPVLQNH